MIRPADMSRFIAIGIGSNTPDGAAQVDAACRWLATAFADVRYSESYLTPGVGVRCAGMTYRNAVATGRTQFSADEVTRMLKEYESSHGRDREVPDVPIDLDLVIYGEEILRPGDFKHMYFQKGYLQLLG